MHDLKSECVKTDVDKCSLAGIDPLDRDAQTGKIMLRMGSVII